MFSMVYDNEAEMHVIVNTEERIEKMMKMFIAALPSPIDYDIDNSADYVANDDETLTYTLDIFKSAKKGLQGEYKDFYEVISHNDDTRYILSDNKEKLRNFCGYINRITT